MSGATVLDNVKARLANCWTVVSGDHWQRHGYRTDSDGSGELSVIKMTDGERAAYDAIPQSERDSLAAEGLRKWSTERCP